jgi:hypothetical protein
MFLNYTFTISSNVSISVQIKPESENSSIGYLALMKFGEVPSVNSYDLWKVFCPSGTF